jgi:cytidine deaminase
MKTVQSYKFGTLLSQMESFRRKSEGPLARKNKSRHVCAVVRGSPVKARCIALTINHTTTRGHFHAEEAMESVLRSLEGSNVRHNVVVARFTSTGELAQSDPCQDCAQLLARFSNVIHRVYYTTDNPALVEYGTPDDVLTRAVLREYRTYARLNKMNG